MKNNSSWDVVIIGGGISGIISLYWAKKRGLKACLLEKAPKVGGIWRTLPSWQDIQMQAGEWTLNGLPINGVKQKDILNNIESWISEYELAEHIITNCPVNRLEWKDSRWIISTAKGSFTARNCIVASGLHNEAFTPNIAKENVTVVEIHSSNLNDSKILAGKQVAILGAGPSAFDSIDLSFVEGASEIHWIYRSTRWMIPSTKPKDFRPGLRILARNQMLVRDSRIISATMERLVREKYQMYGLSEIEPKEPLDLETTQIVVGRPLLTTRFKEVRRHPGSLDKIVGNTLFVGGESFPADILIYGTGYKMNLQFLGLPEFSNLSSSTELSERCGTYVRSLDYPNLFFIGPTILDINGATPLLISMISRTIMSHIMGKCEIPKKVYRKKPVHWGMLSILASFDRHNFWPLLWRIKYTFKAWYYNRYPNRPIFFP